MFATARRTLAALSTASVLVTMSLAAAAEAKPKSSDTPKGAKITAKHKAAIRKFRRNLQASAATGTIVHFKADHQIPGQDPWKIEGWVEQGGAERYRYVQTPPASAITDDSPGIRQIVWGRGGYWAVTDVMTAGRGVQQVTNVGYTDPAHGYDVFVYGLQHIDDAQATFATAPAGPSIGGKPTRAAAVTLPLLIQQLEQSMTVYLDAASQTPVRLLAKLGPPDAPLAFDDAFDFSLWAALPSTASADVLGGEIPLTATIQSTDR